MEDPTPPTKRPRRPSSQTKRPSSKAALDAAEAPITRLTLRVESNDNDAIRKFLCRSRNWNTEADVVGAVVSHQAARRVEELCVAVDVSNRYLYYDEEEKDSQPRFDWPHPDELDGAEPEPPVLRLSFQAATTLVLALCGMPEQDPEDRRGRSRWDIEIDAPRLQSFKYMGLMRRFILRSAAPGVAWVDLHFLRHDPDPYHHYNSDSRDNEKETTRMLFWQFLHNFTSARTVKLKVGNDLKDIAAIGEVGRARLLRCAFPSVERLELEGMHCPESETTVVAIIANLLHFCPVLCEFVLKLSDVSTLRGKDSRYRKEFLKGKDRLDYYNSIDRFVRRWKSKIAISMEDIIFL
jgi:hypothetical protein